MSASDLPYGFRKVHSLLIEQGLLLEADAELPSVTREIVVGPIKGSWWGHPRGREIYAVSRALHEHGDVLATKLVNAKITFVHRSEWGALWSIANSGEPWQTGDLSPDARKLLTRVRQEGRLEAKGNAKQIRNARSTASGERCLRRSLSRNASLSPRPLSAKAMSRRRSTVFSLGFRD